MTKLLLMLFAIAGTSLTFASGGNIESPAVRVIRSEVSTPLSMNEARFALAKQALEQVSDPSELGGILFDTAQRAVRGSNLAPNAQAHNYELDFLKLLVAKGVPINYQSPSSSGRTIMEVLDTYNTGDKYYEQVRTALRGNMRSEDPAVRVIGEQVNTPLSMNEARFALAKKALEQVSDPSKLGRILFDTAQRAVRGSNLAPNAQAHNYELDFLKLLVAKGVPINYQSPSSSGRTIMEVLDTYNTGDKYYEQVRAALRGNMRSEDPAVRVIGEQVNTPLSMNEARFALAKKALEQVSDPSKLGQILFDTAQRAVRGSNLAPNAQAHNYELDFLRLLVAKGVPINYQSPSSSDRTIMEVLDTYNTGDKYYEQVRAALRGNTRSEDQAVRVIGEQVNTPLSMNEARFALAKQALEQVSDPNKLDGILFDTAQRAVRGSNLAPNARAHNYELDFLRLLVAKGVPINYQSPCNSGRTIMEVLDTYNTGDRYYEETRAALQGQQ